MGARVLVTGASGFIGRWSVPALVAAGYEVHAVRTGASARSALPQLAGAQVHAVNLLDPNACTTLIDSVGASHLLHFAWIATPGVYWTSADNERWLAASRHLLERFVQRGGRRVVSAGTCAEYDWSRASVCVETSSALVGATAADVGVTPYARCKVALFDTVQQLRRAGAVSAAHGRIFFQYGPDEPAERLVPSVITHLLAGREALCTHGRQVRSFLHVADVGAAFAALLDSEVEGAVNVGSGEHTSLADMIDGIARHIGRPDLVRLGARPAPPNEPALLVPDVSRLEAELGFRPRYSLAAGLADTIEWWRRHPFDRPS